MDNTVKLFDLLNFVVDYFISRKNKIAELYGIIPDNLKQKIEERDSK